MSRPSFQFYPADWRSNAKLCRCSLAERGAWIGVLCLLHDADEYGILGWPLKDIATAAGVPLATLRALVSKGVLKGDDRRLATPFTFTPYHARKAGPTATLIAAQPGPLWFSSRMVRDEYVRKTSGAATRFGAPSRGHGADDTGHQSIGRGDGSSSSSSSSSPSDLDVELRDGAGGDEGPGDSDHGGRS